MAWQRADLLHYGLHHGLQGSLCSGAWSLFPFFTNLGVCRISLTYSPSSALGAVYHSFLLSFFNSIFLNTLSQRCCHHHWWTWLWPAASLFGNWLALAQLDLGEVSHRSHSCSLPINKNLPCKSNTFVQKLLRFLGEPLTYFVDTFLLRFSF